MTPIVKWYTPHSLTNRSIFVVSTPFITLSCPSIIYFIQLTSLTLTGMLVFSQSTVFPT